MNVVRFHDCDVQPGKVVCIGRNYAEHISELSNEIPELMVVFVKPNSSISDTLCARHGEPLHYEGEICFLMQEGHIAGVGFGLDLTKRELQSYLKRKGLPWERSKAFDGSAVFSPFVPFDGDLADLTLELQINQERIQSGGVKQMMFPPLKILSELESFMTLADGDIVMTGTPKGVGEIKPGDHFLGRILYRDTLLVQKEWTAI